jgi:hypothetical protein
MTQVACQMLHCFWATRVGDFGGQQRASLMWLDSSQRSLPSMMACVAF